MPSRRNKPSPNPAPVITSSRLMRGERGRLVWRNAFALIAVTLACAILASSIWIAARRAIARQDQATLARAKAVVTGQVNILAESVRQKISTIDQSLAILQALWERNPDGFSLQSWKSRIPALTRLSDDIFIANSKLVIVQDILPQGVSQGVGAPYVHRGNGTLRSVIRAYRDGDEPGLVTRAQVQDGTVRQYLMYLIRPLHTPKGWLIGASYRSSALVKVFAEGALGPNGVVALIDARRGGVQAIAGPAAVHPRLNVFDTAMFKAITAGKTVAGTWIGPTGMDGEVRIHAYRRIPDRNLLVLAGIDKADWMAPATAWAHQVEALAAVASGFVVGLGGLMLWVLWRLDSNRRRRFALEQAAIRLNSANSALEAAQRAAQAGMAQIRAVMEVSSDGIALFDADWRLVAWNTPFALSAGLAADALHEGLPIDALMRQQGRAGLLGAGDLEGEIARRLAALQTDMELATFDQTAPDGEALLVRGRAMPDGAVMLVVTRAGDAPRPYAQVAAPPIQPVPEHSAHENVGSRTVEW